MKEVGTPGYSAHRTTVISKYYSMLRRETQKKAKQLSLLIIASSDCQIRSCVCEVMADAPFGVTWTRQANKDDYIRSSGKYGSYRSVSRKGATVTIEALPTQGSAEVRYVGRQRNTIASRPIQVLPAVVRLMAADEVMAAAVVNIGWTRFCNTKSPQGEMRRILFGGACATLPQTPSYRGELTIFALFVSHR